jgi:hypothetical protein
VAAALHRHRDPSAHETLEQALEQGDSLSRLRAAVSLAASDSTTAASLRQAIEVAALKAKRTLRWRAFVELHRLGDARFETELKASLSGKEQAARLDAAWTLAPSNPKALGVLVQLAQQADDPLDRVAAAGRAAQLGEAGGVKALTGLLAPAMPAAVRARAITALGRLARVDPARRAALSPLVVNPDESDRALRTAVAVALLGAGEVEEQIPRAPGGGK